MRVLGVDPGLTRCGLGVVEGDPGRALHMVAVGHVRTSPEDDIAQRLLALEATIDAWVEPITPTWSPSSGSSPSTTCGPSWGRRRPRGRHPRGRPARACRSSLHTPSEVKAAVTGSGRADKAQVTAMVTRLLRLTEAPKPADAADALALAICHVWRGGAQARIAAAVAGPGGGSA